MGFNEANAFLKIWALGYHRLCSVVPPNAPLSENSSLWKRMQKDASKDSRGKVPGLRGNDGRWYGYDFVKHESTLADIERWASTDASAGTKTGKSLYALDADTYDKASAKIIHDAIVRRFGNLAVRIGQYPKALYLIRLSSEMQYKRIEFGDAHTEGKLRGKHKDRLEVLGEGRQFVAHGIHPKTMEPYKWVPSMPAYADIPVVDPSEVIALLEELRHLLPRATEVRTEGGVSDGDTDQTLLKGDLEEVRRAVKALPNTTELFPERENYLHVGYMIKAALADHPDEAFALFLEWAEKWEDGVSTDEDGFVIAGNDPDMVRADWDRMQPPFRAGAAKLFDLATKLSGGEYDQAERWLEPEGSDERLFPPEPGTRDAELASGTILSNKYKLLTIEDLFNRPDPRYLIDRHLPETGVGFLYGAPSSGKSFIAIDMALTLAFGRESWHGDVINGPEGRCVIYIAGEGASGFKHRVRAWMNAREIPEGVRGRFALIEESIDFMSIEDIEKLVRTLREDTGCPVALVVVDTVSRAIPGADENLQKDMSLFVAACTRVERRCACVVMGVHHAGKSGDMRGSTVLLGAGDFVFRLDRKKGESIGVLTCDKMKDGPDAWKDAYRFDEIALEGGASSLVPTRCSMREFEAASGAGAGGGVAEDVVASVLEAVREAWDKGNPWGMKAGTGERAYVRRMVADFGLTAEKASKIMSRFLEDGNVVEELFSKKSKMKGIRFVKGIENQTTDDWLDAEDETNVVSQEPVTEAPSNSVFD